MTQKNDGGGGKPPATLKDLIASVGMQKRIQQVIPKHLSAERMIRLATLALVKTPDLQKCEVETVITAVMQASQLGLEIGRHAHMVPFYNKHRGAHECVMIPDYRGFCDLAWRSAQVLVDARLVYEGDDFTVDYGTEAAIRHVPNLKGDRAPAAVIAAYMVARFPDGRVKFDVMTREELEAIRKRSRAKDSGPWVTDPGEMYKKTVVKRGMKLVPQSPELAEAIELDNRVESGDVGSFTDFDSPESLQARATDATKQKTEDLKRRLAEASESSTSTEGGSDG